MLFLLASALAAPPDVNLTWDLAVNGSRIGTRTVTVKLAPGDGGSRRILEAWTEINGTVGPMSLRFRQRLTAHVDGHGPASFHSVIDENGNGSEIQGRWTPSGWFVTSNLGGRARTVEYPPSRIDFSTADLMDPESRVAFAGRTQASLLSGITGEVQSGAVTGLGPSTIDIDGQSVPVQGYAWASPEGKARFYYSDEGYLVRYESRVMGLQLTGTLTDPPPGGVDDFPVAIGRPQIDALPL